ncbi:MAG TPA: hypothetical protein VG754_04715, partial [Verrucomicrobiae bacterium]|nr:hypothetical protein [Verrucomicrobiae bacterium]
MRNPKIEGRKQYQPSGKINWAKFFPFALLSFFAAVVLAVILAVLFNVGFYLILLVPILAGLGLGGTVLLAVKMGHCRSPMKGALLGAVGGIILYLGYYYIGMEQTLGRLNPGDIFLLPRYIKVRMDYTVIKDVHTPDSNKDDDQKPTGFRTGSNWLFFALEFGFIVGIAAGSGLRWSRKPYCENCRTWMSRETTTFTPEVGPGFVEALRLGSVQSLAALFTSPQKPSAPHTAVAVDYCPRLKEGAAKDCDIYLSVKQVVAAAKGVTLNSFDQSKGKFLAQQVLLNRTEVPAVLVRFPSLESVAGTTAAQALQELQVEMPPAPSPHAMAEVMPVDPLHAKKVLTTKTGLIVTAFTLMAFLGVFVAIGLGALGGYLGFPQPAPAGGVPIVMKILGSILIGVAILIFVTTLVLVFTSPGYFGSRYLRKLTETEFRKRSKPLVSTADADARFVQVIPRANWAKLKLIDATDIGFLRVDKQRGELLFEGDKENYRVPAAAITSCEIETFIQGQGSHGATTLYRVVLQANHPSGF